MVLCLLMTVQLFIFVGFVLKICLKIFNDALHFVDLINFILILFDDLLYLLLLLVQALLQLVLFLVVVFPETRQLGEITVLLFLELPLKVDESISFLVDLLRH